MQKLILTLFTIFLFIQFIKCDVDYYINSCYDSSDSEYIYYCCNMEDIGEDSYICLECCSVSTAAVVGAIVTVIIVIFCCICCVVCCIGGAIAVCCCGISLSFVTMGAAKNKQIYEEERGNIPVYQQGHYYSVQSN